jgi:hypothetical protein
LNNVNNNVSAGDQSRTSNYRGVVNNRNLLVTVDNEDNNVTEFADILWNIEFDLEVVGTSAANSNWVNVLLGKTEDKSNSGVSQIVLVNTSTEGSNEWLSDIGSSNLVSDVSDCDEREWHDWDVTWASVDKLGGEREDRADSQWGVETVWHWQFAEVLVQEGSVATLNGSNSGTGILNVWVLDESDSTRVSGNTSEFEDGSDVDTVSWAAETKFVRATLGALWGDSIVSEDGLDGLLKSDKVGVFVVIDKKHLVEESAVETITNEVLSAESGCAFVVELVL